MRDGTGNEYFILFSAAGAILKGFDHESAMTPYGNVDRKIWPGVLDGVPEEFATFLKEPAFDLEATTFCIWRRTADACWHCGSIVFPDGDDPDGSEGLLWMLDGKPAAYAQFAKEYFEVELPIDGIEDVYRHKAMTAGLVASLNSKKSLEEALEEANEIGYGVT